MHTRCTQLHTMFETAGYMANIHTHVWRLQLGMYTAKAYHTPGMQLVTGNKTTWSSVVCVCWAWNNIGREILDSSIFRILNLRLDLISYSTVHAQHYSIAQIFHLDLIFVRMSIYENKIHTKKPALRYHMLHSISRLETDEWSRSILKQLVEWSQ